MATGETSAGRLRLGIALVVVGLALGVPSAVAAFAPAARSLSSPSHTVPPDLQLRLEEGDWAIFERTGRRREAGPVKVERNDMVSIPAEQVLVTSMDGTPLPVRDIGATTETLTRGSSIYTAVARFDVPATGDYELHIATGRAHDVVVTRPVGTTLSAALPWLAVAAVGGLLFVTGWVFVAMTVLSRRPSVPAAVAARPPRGWYPDPEAHGSLRYWDGVRWTVRRERHA